MNRWDEIQGLARDIASNIHAEPAARDAMANDLIKLCGAMINAVGKGVAIDGESSMNDGDDASAHARYLVGERIQTGADEAVRDAVDVDLDRWTRPSPGDPCQCGHVPSVHRGGTDHNGDSPCVGEQYNGAPCKGGPCNGFVRRVPDWGWKPVDRRPAALRASSGPVTVVVPDREPVLLGNPEPVNLDGFGATSVAASRRSCCYVSQCALCRSGQPLGRCCYPLRDVCPSHH
ncbi:hypothetical protein AVT62_gp52 [Streptomyces phage TP1604]|uniref:Uncharacterized protein n=2 Tax=Woodruffvirus TP1604 TaxID=1982746 RepID=A0A1P8VW35_9CAUD|nr:hypothetical protein AVT62_gp52 [Streptomyces phage TP1604]AKA61790.1 hypothetical protein SEA_TP1604_52 [Streptomyces phage TP1604]APZ82221.1 hypothetical protein SEA_BABYGOTBAC_53 [Streptomyces phage BabyGotBac]